MDVRPSEERRLLQGQGGGAEMRGVAQRADTEVESIQGTVKSAGSCRDKGEEQRCEGWPKGLIQKLSPYKAQ